MNSIFTYVRFPVTILAILILSLPLKGYSAEDVYRGEHYQKRRFQVFAELNNNTSSITTLATSSTLASSTAIQIIAAEVGADYFVHPNLAVTAQVFFALTTSIAAETQGFDVGLRYFPFKNGYQTNASLLGSRFSSTPGLTPFLYLGFANRQFQFGNTQLSFQGVEVGGGADFHFRENYFLRGTLNYQQFQNAGSRTLAGFVAGVAIGYAF